MNMNATLERVDMVRYRGFVNENTSKDVVAKNMEEAKKAFRLIVEAVTRNLTALFNRSFPSADNDNDDGDGGHTEAQKIFESFYQTIIEDGALNVVRGATTGVSFVETSGEKANVSPFVYFQPFFMDSMYRLSEQNVASRDMFMIFVCFHLETKNDENYNKQLTSFGAYVCDFYFDCIIRMDMAFLKECVMRENEAYPFAHGFSTRLFDKFSRNEPVVYKWQANPGFPRQRADGLDGVVSQQMNLYVPSVLAFAFSTRFGYGRGVEDSFAILRWLYSIGVSGDGGEETTLGARPLFPRETAFGERLVRGDIFTLTSDGDERALEKVFPPKWRGETPVDFCIRRGLVTKERRETLLKDTTVDENSANEEENAKRRNRYEMVFLVALAYLACLPDIDDDDKAHEYMRLYADKMIPMLYKRYREGMDNAPANALSDKKGRPLYMGSVASVAHNASEETLGYFEGKGRTKTTAAREPVFIRDKFVTTVRRFNTYVEYAAAYLFAFDPRVM